MFREEEEEEGGCPAYACVIDNSTVALDVRSRQCNMTLQTVGVVIFAAIALSCVAFACYIVRHVILEIRKVVPH